MNNEERKQEIINEINIKLHDYPNLFFDDSVDMPSINNRIKEFSDEEPIWEDYSDEDDLELENCSEDDLSNLLWEMDRHIEKDDKLMERCNGYDW